MRIKQVEVVALQAPEAPGVKSACLVRVMTDEGIEGFGQAELPSLIAQAFVRTREWTWYFSGGLEQVLKGQDPLRIGYLWNKMYASMWLYGRRGAGIAVLGAIDTALWDIKGKYYGKPLFELLGPRLNIARDEGEFLGPKKYVRAYATIYPSGSTPEEIRANVAGTVDAGFRAVKIEEQPGGLGRMSARRDAQLLAAAREALGAEGDLMVDYQYILPSFAEALSRIRALQPYAPYFVEAPLPPDNLSAYARLAEAVDVPIAAGDGGFTTKEEFIELMEVGRVDIVQPSTVRSGGITEIVNIASEAYRRGVLCIPHCYAWMIGVAAALHLAAVFPNMPYIEMPAPHPTSPLVQELLLPPPRPEDGWVAVPKRPGLGFELNERVIERYRAEPA